ncbi:hypothetical protein ACTXT7_006035, partial [Hymenolepis weldensis]
LTTLIPLDGDSPSNILVSNPSSSVSSDETRGEASDDTGDDVDTGLTVASSLEDDFQLPDTRRSYSSLSLQTSQLDQIRDNLQENLKEKLGIQVL